MSSPTLTPGRTASRTVTVDSTRTAQALGSGLLPVFATPALVALLETAACACVDDCLEPGQTSVGTKIDLDHCGASAVGASITATATIDAVAGHRLEFTVEARDGDRLIGHGHHTRAIVDITRFMGRLDQ